MEIRRKWDPRRIAAAAFGGLLWLQLGAAPLSRELAFPEPDPRRIIVYLLPLALLLVASAKRNKIAALLLFPCSIGGVMVVAPSDFTSGQGAPLTVVLAGLTLVAYIMAASAWLQLPSHQTVLGASREPVRRDLKRWRPYRGMFAPRAVLLVAAFGVTAAAVALSPDLVARAQTAFGTSSDPQAVEMGVVLTSLILFFAWCVMAFMLFVAPTLETESRVRHLETQMRATLFRSESTHRKVLFFLVVLAGLALMGALILLRYR